jgi:hypothetical protein
MFRNRFWTAAALLAAALWAPRSASAGITTFPVQSTSSFQVSVASNVFHVAGTTTDTTVPIVTLAVDGSTFPVSHGVGNRHGIGAIVTSVGDASVVGNWHLDTSTFSVIGDIVTPSTIALNGEPPGFNDPALDLVLYCQGGPAGCIPDLNVGISSNALVLNNVTNLVTTWNGAYVPAASPRLSELNGTFGGNGFTLEFWAQFNANTLGIGEEAAVGESSDGNSDGYWIGVNPDPTPGLDGRWTAYVAGSLNGSHTRIIDPVPQTGNYSHLTLTYNPNASGSDPAGMAKFYVNGRLAGSLQVGAITTSAAEFQLGRIGTLHTSALLKPFKGAVDEVRFLNFPQTQDQVVADFISGTVRYSIDDQKTWTYQLDQTAVAFSGSDALPAVDTITAQGFHLVDCSTRNYVAFISEGLNGILSGTTASGVIPTFQIPVTTETAAVAVSISTTALSTSGVTWQWDKDLTPAGGPLCSHQYVVVTATAVVNGTTTIDSHGVMTVFPSTGTEIVLTTVTAQHNLSTPTNSPTSFSQGGFTPNFPFAIKVKSLNELGVGGTTTFTVVYTTANAPSGSHMVFTSSESAQISWNANGNPSYTTYYVYLDGAITKSTYTIGITTATFVGLSTNSIHTWQVSAVDGNGYETPKDVLLSTVTMEPFLGNIFDHTKHVQLSGVLENRFFQIEIQGETFQKDYSIVVRDSYTADNCGLTGSQPPTPGSPTPPGSGHASFFFDVEPPQQPIFPVTVRLTYEPGELAALAVQPPFIELKRRDAGTGKCIPAVTKANNTGLTAELNHLTVWQIGTSAPTSIALKNARVYPNPIYLSRGGNGYFIFDGLPPGATLHIYTLRGERVYDDTANAVGEIRWDAKNKIGRQVASGLYIAVLTLGNDKRIMKLGVER